MPSLSAEIPALVPGELSSTDTRDERDTPTQEMLYQAFNIDPSAPCELQRPDVNFFEVRWDCCERWHFSLLWLTTSLSRN